MEILNLTMIVSPEYAEKRSRRAYCLSAKSFNTSYAHHNAATNYENNNSEFSKSVGDLYDIRYGTN